MPVERPILIVDDDSALRAMLAEQLAEDDEFNPVAVAGLSEADQSLGAAATRFATLLLDVGLPDGKVMRAKSINIELRMCAVFECTRIRGRSDASRERVRRCA